MPRFIKIAAFAAFTILSSQGVSAQETALQPEDSFTSENAVLDTSILFAIGGREARQELRGAFGWPTFQEGLVEGVYYRFDPDGYARFAPTPRLDTDVFEVICRPRTLVCMGRKDALQVTLNSRGQVQLEIANITDKDQFILADGISELPLPPAILQPLEPRLELLLAAGGELIVRRNGSDGQKISLAGFGAVVPYLRWVAARQDYTVLPRGWPVPNTSTGKDRPGLTQTSLWQSPMPQPHVVTQAQPQGVISSQLGVTTPTSTTGGQVQQDVAEVRGELNILRELLLEQQTQPENPVGQPPNTGVSHPMADLAASNTSQQLEGRIAELLQMTVALQQELSSLQRTQVPQVPLATPPIQPSMGSASQIEPENPKNVARHLDYLMTEVGLAPDVALMVVQQAQQSQQASADVAQAEQDEVINDILRELRSQLPNQGNVQDANNQLSQPQPSQEAASGQEFQLLTDYLQSTVREQ